MKLHKDNHSTLQFFVSCNDRIDALNRNIQTCARNHYLFTQRWNFKCFRTIGTAEQSTMIC